MTKSNNISMEIPGSEGAGTSQPGKDVISNRLRDLYASVQEEKLPDRFLQLLDKLSQAEESYSGNDGLKG